MPPRKRSKEPVPQTTSKLESEDGLDEEENLPDSQPSSVDGN